MRESGPAPVKLDRLNSHQIATDAYKDSSASNDRQAPFTDHRSAALSLLNSATHLTRKAGSFLGQCAVDPLPLSEAQRGWLDTLLERAGMPPFTGNARAGEAMHG
jgi:hypothetical protein